MEATEKRRVSSFKKTETVAVEVEGIIKSTRELGEDEVTGLIGYKAHNWAYGNIWAIELPFIIASVLMLVSAVVLFITIKENKVSFNDLKISIT